MALRLCTAEATSGLLSLISQYNRDMSLLELVQFRATETIKGLSCEERLIPAETIQPREEKTLEGNVYQSRVGGKEDEEAVVFSVVPTGRTRDYGVNANRKFHLNTGKIFYCEGAQTLEQGTHRDFGVSICGDTQNPTGHGLGQHAVPDPV